MKVSFVYISLSGNTESFVRRLSDYLLEAHPGLEIEKVHDERPGQRGPTLL